MMKVLRFYPLCITAFLFFLILGACEDGLEVKNKKTKEQTHFEPRLFDVNLSDIELIQEEVKSMSNSKSKSGRGGVSEDGEVYVSLKTDTLNTDEAVHTKSSKSGVIPFEGPDILAMQIRDADDAGEAIYAELFCPVDMDDPNFKIPSVWLGVANIKVVAYLIPDGMSSPLYREGNNFFEPFSSSIDNPVEFKKNVWVYEDFQLVHNEPNMINDYIRISQDKVMCIVPEVRQFYSESAFTVDENTTALNLTPFAERAFRFRFNIAKEVTADSFKFVIEQAEGAQLSDTITVELPNFTGEARVSQNYTISGNYLNTQEGDQMKMKIIFDKSLTILDETFLLKNSETFSLAGMATHASFFAINITKNSEKLWDQRPDGSIIFYINDGDTFDPDIGVATGGKLYAAIDTAMVTLPPWDYPHQHENGLWILGASDLSVVHKIQDMMVRDYVAMGLYNTRRAAEYYRPTEGRDGPMDNRCAFTYADSYTGANSEEEWFLPDHKKIYKLFQRYTGQDLEILKKLFEGTWSSRIPAGGIREEEGGYVISSEADNIREPFYTKRAARPITYGERPAIGSASSQEDVLKYLDAGAYPDDAFANGTLSDVFLDVRNANTDNFYKKFGARQIKNGDGTKYLSMINAGVSPEGMLLESQGGRVFVANEDNPTSYTVFTAPLHYGIEWKSAFIIEDSNGVFVDQSDDKVCEGRTIAGYNDWFLPDTSYINNANIFSVLMRYATGRYKLGFTPYLRSYGQFLDYTGKLKYSELGNQSGYPMVNTNTAYHRCVRLYDDNAKKNKDIYNRYKIEDLMNSPFYSMKKFMDWNGNDKIYTVRDMFNRYDISSRNQIMTYLKEQEGWSDKQALDYIAKQCIADGGNEWLAYVDVGQEERPPSSIEISKGQALEMTFKYEERRIRVSEILNNNKSFSGTMTFEEVKFCYDNLQKGPYYKGTGWQGLLGLAIWDGKAPVNGKIRVLLLWNEEKYLDASWGTYDVSAARLKRQTSSSTSPLIQYLPAAKIP